MNAEKEHLRYSVSFEVRKIIKFDYGVVSYWFVRRLFNEKTQTQFEDFLMTNFTNIEVLRLLDLYDNWSNCLGTVLTMLRKKEKC